MDGGEDEVILVEQRRPRLVAGGVGRVERQLGQEALARGIAGGDLLELEQVGGGCGVLVDAFQCGSYHARTRSISAGQPARRRASPRASPTKPGQSAAARAGGG